MSETRYLAVAFASRSANGHLRPAVSDAAPEGAKVVRTRADVVAAVYEIDEDTDPRTEAERLRLIIAAETDDDDLTAMVMMHGSQPPSVLMLVAARRARTGLYTYSTALTGQSTKGGERCRSG